MSELQKLVDEHITLLSEARRERDDYKKQAANLLKALGEEQALNSDLLAALKRVTFPEHVDGNLFTHAIGHYGTGGPWRLDARDNNAALKAIKAAEKQSAGEQS